MSYFLRLCISLSRCLIGALEFICYKRNRSYFYQGFIEIFCLTKGYSHLLGSQFISIFHPSKLQLPFRMWDKDFTKTEVDSINSQINQEGVVVLDYKIPSRVVDTLLAFTKKKQAILRQTDQQLREGVNLEMEIFDAKSVKAVRYEYEILELAREEIVQEILAQPFFIAISAKYLKTTPVLDIIQCWWHTSFGGAPDENAAQKYHFDLERLKWLKVFIYLNDVDIYTGPHCFIRSSHIPGKIPFQLLKRGYARINDRDVFQFFDKSKESVITGKSGTIVLEDTRGLHKGMHVQSGARLMFQLQFSNSLFGAPLSINPKERANMSKNLEDFSKKAVGVFDYLFKINTEGT